MCPILDSELSILRKRAWERSKRQIRRQRFNDLLEFLFGWFF